jgi:hypothetical protein
MTSRQLLVAAGLTALCAIGPGCRYYSSKPDDSGITETEIKKLMEAPAPGSTEPSVLEVSADETMELLLDSEIAKSATDALKANKRRLIGKVLETSPEGSETPFVILDGGTHGDQVCKVKCLLVADQRDALKNVKAGDEVRVTGSSDGVITSGTLEFKNCILNSGAASAAPAPKP